LKIKTKKEANNLLKRIFSKKKESLSDKVMKSSFNYIKTGNSQKKISF